MEYEEEMRPEKNTMPNYFNEWSTFNERSTLDVNHENKSSMTIIKYFPTYEVDISGNIEIDYASDIEY